MQNKRVRRELGQHNKDEALEDLQIKYDMLVEEIEAAGFNPGVFDGSIVNIRLGLQVIRLMIKPFAGDHAPWGSMLMVLVKLQYMSPCRLACIWDSHLGNYTVL